MSVAAAGKSNVCLFCQFARHAKPKRFPTNGTRTTTAPFSTATRPRDARESSSPSSKNLQTQIQLYSPVDLFRSTFLAKRHRDLPGAAPRVKAFQKQELIPPPPVGNKDVSSDGMSRHLLTADILQTQLEACKDSKDFIRVISTAFRSLEGARWIASPSMQQLFTRNVANRTIGPQQRLIAFNRMISYLRASNAPVSLELYFEALKQAASCNCLVAFRKILTHLWNHRRKSGGSKLPSKFMPRFVVLRVVNALNHGRRKAMRYEKRTENAIRELLYGDPAIPKHQRVCLRSFLPASDDGITQAWTSLLEGYEMFAEIETEWEAEDVLSENRPLQRGQLLLGLIRARLKNGRVERAWNLIHEYDNLNDSMSAKAIASDKQNIGQLFLDNLESMPRRFSDITMACIESQCTYTLERKMKDIETELGVKWVPSTAGHLQSGHHVLHNIEKLIGEDASTRRHSGEKLPPEAAA